MQKRLHVISYWNGVLPDITELHFRSFLAYHDESVAYCLYLEEGSSISEKMAWLHDEPRIQIRYINLKEALTAVGLDHLLEPTSPRAENFRNAWNAVYRRWLKIVGNRVPFAASPRPALLGWRTKPFGYTPRYSRLWNSPIINKAMMGDLFRILYSTILAEDTFYVDLDVAFCVDVRSFIADRSFIYRWQKWPFGNSAVMYVPAGASIKRDGSLVALCRKLGTPLPWVLFSDKYCRQIDMDIADCAKFDPFWVDNPFGVGNFGAFFEALPDSEARARFIQENCWMFHWHNHWSAVRISGSPYDMLLKALPQPQSNVAVA